MSTADAPDPLHNVRSIATRLGISVRSVRRLIARGDLPIHRIGRLIRIAEKDIVRYIRDKRN